MISLNDKLIAAISSIVVVFFACLKAASDWFERNSIARKQETRLERSLLLSRFLTRLERMESSGASQEGLQDARQRVLTELNHELRLISEVFGQGTSVEISNAPLTRSERVLLLYKPIGWRAWTAHLLFYVSGLASILVSIGSFLDDNGNPSLVVLRSEWSDPATLGALALYVVLTAVAYRWATVLRRKQRGVVWFTEEKYLNKKGLATVVLYWYLFILVMGLLILPFEGYGDEPPRLFWTRRLVAAFTTIIAFWWRRDMPQNAVKTSWTGPTSTKQWIALISLFASVIWCVLCSAMPWLIIQTPEQTNEIQRAIGLTLFCLVPLLCSIELAQIYLGVRNVHQSTAGQARPGGV